MNQIFDWYKKGGVYLFVALHAFITVMSATYLSKNYFQWVNSRESGGGVIFTLFALASYMFLFILGGRRDSFSLLDRQKTLLTSALWLIVALITVLATK